MIRLLKRAALGVAWALLPAALAMAYVEYPRSSDGAQVGASLGLWLNALGKAVETSVANPLPVAPSPTPSATSSAAAAVTCTTGDTTLRNANTARKQLVAQLQSANACVALRYGAAASLTDGSSILLGSGCTAPEPVGWQWGGNVIDTQALHCTAQGSSATVLTWENQ